MHSVPSAPRHRRGRSRPSISTSISTPPAADSMRQIARFLWSVESATIPIRLNSIRIQSAKEGTDQLNVKLVVSALYMPTGQNSNVGNDVLDALEGMQ